MTGESLVVSGERVTDIPDAGCESRAHGWSFARTLY